MNRKIILLGVFLIFAFFSGCEDKEVKKTPPELGKLEVSVESLNFVANDVDKSFSVTSDTRWTVTVICNGNWLICDPNICDGDHTVSVSAADNTTPYIREAIIVVKTRDGVVKNIQVKQIGTEAAILVAPTTVVASCEGEEKEIVVTASDAWEASISDDDKDWITLKSVDKDKAVFSFFKNETGKNRSAEIIFKLKSRDKQTKVDVSQEYIRPENIEYPNESTLWQNITITGNNLRLVEEVWFGAIQGTITAGRTDESLVVSVPEETTPGEVDLKIVYSGNQMIVGKITLKYPVPEVTAPSEGIIGLDITITGTKLNYIDQVFFGAEEGEILTGRTDVSMKVLIPETATEGEVDLKIVYFGINLTVGKITLSFPPDIPEIDDVPTEGAIGQVITLTGKSLLLIDKVLFGDVEGVISDRTDLSMKVLIPSTATAGEVDLIIVFGDESLTLGKIMLEDAAFDPDKNLALYAGTLLPNFPKVIAGNANSCGANGRQPAFAFDGVIDATTNAELSDELATIYNGICADRGAAHTNWQVGSTARAGDPDLASNPGQIWIKLDYSDTDAGIVVFDKIGFVARENNGLVTGYTVEISMDNVNWTKVVNTNVPFPNSYNRVDHILDQTVEAKYVRWVCMTTTFSPEGGAPVGGNNNTGLRNFYLWRTKK